MISHLADDIFCVSYNKRPNHNGFVTPLEFSLNSLRDSVYYLSRIVLKWHEQICGRKF